MEPTRLASTPPDPITTVLGPALKVGVACGGAGFLLGGASGVLRGAPGFLFGVASGLQSFVLGTTFTACRTGVLGAWTTNHDELTPRDLTKASAIAGGMSGGLVGLLTRGRSNAIPGALMMAIFGAAGQHAFNGWSASSQTSHTSSGPGFWKRMSEKSWSPVKLMTDKEYADILQERLLKVDVEIAMIDDKIAALRAQQSSADIGAVPAPKDE